MSRPRIRDVVTILAVLIAMESPVDAYLDPGSGSMFLQLLLGGAAGAGVILKLYWHRLTAMFRSRTPSESSDRRNDP